MADDGRLGEVRDVSAVTRFDACVRAVLVPTWAELVELFDDVRATSPR